MTNRLELAQRRRTEWGATLNRLGAIQQKIADAGPRANQGYPANLLFTPAELVTLDSATRTHAEHVRRQIELVDAEVAKAEKLEATR